ncbi:EFR1 family ferrodoxin [Clostridium sp. AM58-1XD]|uniref:EFR1 family ferrodoxin n=1 Tax=Clostridium sp. AM58-1XD TaxID=2292307 RepID=UPI000E54426F|nr:EFR1 family ferrodoxin [Clostridium sp. AM58-1XD]RGY96848.1 4Fe-4S dicluster domain-containing protein [Clostridium sp. AM58-1XD]
MIHKITAIYFSPTGTSRREAVTLAAALGEEIAEIDLSCPCRQEISFTEGDLVVVSGPVYGGRLPSYMTDKLKDIHGNGAAAVTLAVYGNRAYEDALLELNDCMAEQGFSVIASAALIAQHSIINEVAAGRPDAADEKEVTDFAAKVLNKYASSSSSRLKVPGDRPYKTWTPMPVTPVVSDHCLKCGLCAQKCPTGAIDMDHPQQTDALKCILCMRCISVCPEHARAIPSSVRENLAQKLGPLKEIRRPNEFYI